MGAIDSEVIPTRSENQIIFDTSAGHNHDGSNSRLIDLGGVVHRKVFAVVATERSEATSAWTDTATAFTFTAPVGALILGIRATFEHKCTGSGAAGLRFKIVGSNLGTWYTMVNTGKAGIGTGSQLYGNQLLTQTSGLVTGGIAYTDNTSYVTYDLYIPAHFVILDASTVFTVQLSNNGGGGVSAQCKNVSLEVVYANSFTED